MQINVSGHHVEVTDSLRAYAIEKLEKISDHTDNATNLDVVLSVEKIQHTA